MNSEFVTRLLILSLMIGTILNTWQIKKLKDKPLN